MGVPTYGSAKHGRAQTSAAEELTRAPEAQVLGTIPQPDFDDRPPWEVDERFGRHDTDARRFVEVPEDWVLRWLNPRLIDQVGMRYWRTVPAFDKSKVKVKVQTLVSPEGYIRRGGPGSDILCYMPRAWYESRQRHKLAQSARMTQSAVDRAQNTVERINRGEFGSAVSDASVTHPTHTIADGKSMRD